jgi:hypothetical protein
MINVQSSDVWEWERRGRINEDPEQVCISLMVPCYACREFSGGNGENGACGQEGGGSAK